MSHAPGRAFVTWYYENSPPLAELISRQPALRAVTRAVLTPVVFAIEYPSAAGAVLVLGFTLIGLRLRRRRERFLRRPGATF